MMIKQGFGASHRNSSAIQWKSSVSSESTPDALADKPSPAASLDRRIDQFEDTYFSESCVPRQYQPERLLYDGRQIGQLVSLRATFHASAVSGSWRLPPEVRLE